MAWPERQTIQFAENLDPTNRPLHGRIVVDFFQGTERQICFGSCEVIEFAFGCRGQHPNRIASIKRKYLRPWIAEPLCGHQPKRSGFARTGGSNDQRVAEVRNMQIKSERSSSACSR